MWYLGISGIPVQGWVQAGLRIFGGLENEILAVGRDGIIGVDIIRHAVRCNCVICCDGHNQVRISAIICTSARRAVTYLSETWIIWHFDDD